MTIRVTSDQVDNARLLIALDRAQGRATDEWILRLARATPEASSGDSSAGPATPTVAELAARLRALEQEVARLRADG